jgi:hypothetical protein
MVVTAASLGTTIERKLCTGMRLEVCIPEIVPRDDRVQFLMKQEEKGH